MIKNILFLTIVFLNMSCIAQKLILRLGPVRVHIIDKSSSQHSIDMIVQDYDQESRSLSLKDHYFQQLQEASDQCACIGFVIRDSQNVDAIYSILFKALHEWIIQKTHNHCSIGFNDIYIIVENTQQLSALNQKLRDYKVFLLYLSCSK